jgi:hypothetical protein
VIAIMYGLTVRWSLTESPEGVAQALRDYVTGTSVQRFTGMPGLRFKLWRMIEGEWFEGTYVFATAEARDEFAASFTATMATAPASQITGAPPLYVEPCEIVAVAEGAAGFMAAAPLAAAD